MGRTIALKSTLAAAAVLALLLAAFGAVMIWNAPTDGAGHAQASHPATSPTTEPAAAPVAATTSAAAALHQRANGADTPEDAVRGVLPANSQGQIVACRPLDGPPFQDPACPVSDRLRTLLTTTGFPFEPILRTQSVVRDLTVRPAVPSNTGASTVEVDYNNGPDMAITFTVISENGRWFVDDTACTHIPGTSLYDNPVGCPA